MRINVDLLEGERLSLSLEGSANRIAFERPVDGQEAALRRLLSDQGGYIFLIAEDLPTADLRSHNE